MKVIHHNKAFDVEAFISKLKSSYIGIDADDYQTFLTKGNEVHTFVGESDKDERVLSAIENAIKSDDAEAVIANASAVMMVILRSKESSRPLSMSEMQNISKAFKGFKEEIDVVWSVSDDDTLGDTIKVIFFINIKQ